MIGRTILAVLALLSSRAVQAGEVDLNGLAMPIERASPEECAIIAAVGKAKLNWGAAVPKDDFIPTAEGSAGGTYVEDCPWRRYGLAEPRLGSYRSPENFEINKPQIEGRHATAGYGFSVWSKAGDRVDLFVAGGSYDLEKRGRIWRVIRCSMKVINSGL